jgi:hypothetical protein
MNFSKVIPNHALLGKATPTLAGQQGSRRFGDEAAIPIGSNLHMLARKILALSTNKIVNLNLSTGEFTLPEDANTDAVAQVESVTASGTITAAGSVAVTVASSSGGYEEFPRTYNVRVKVGDTAATWANKVRLQLSRDSVINNYYEVGGSSTAITLTRRITPFGEEDDGILSITTANGTCTGVSGASSTTTTSGVAFVGALVDLNEATDAEGLANPAQDGLAALLVVVRNGTLTIADNPDAPEEFMAIATGSLTGSSAVQISNGVIPSTLTFKNSGTRTLSAVITWAYEPEA